MLASSAPPGGFVQRHSFPRRSHHNVFGSFRYSTDVPSGHTRPAGLFPGLAFNYTGSGATTVAPLAHGLELHNLWNTAITTTACLSSFRSRARKGIPGSGGEIPALDGLRDGPAGWVFATQTMPSKLVADRSVRLDYGLGGPGPERGDLATGSSRSP